MSEKVKIKKLSENLFRTKANIQIFDLGRTVMIEKIIIKYETKW